MEPADEEERKGVPHRFVKIIVLQRRDYHEQNLQNNLEQNEKLLRGGIGDRKTQREELYQRELRRESERKPRRAGVGSCVKCDGRRSVYHAAGGDGG